MRKFLLLAVLLLCGRTLFAAAPTIAQHKSNFLTSSNTITVTFGSNITAGDMVLAWVGCGGAGAPTINTPTINGSANTFVKVAGASNAGGSTGQSQSALYVINSISGSTSNAVTATFSSAADDPHLHIMDISGQAASPQDATGNTQSATMSVSTSGSTTTANDLVIAFFYDNSNNVTFSAGTGYSQVEQTNDSTNGDSAFSESKTVSSTGVQTATGSGNGSDSLGQGIIAIAGASGGGGAAPNPQYLTMGVGFLATNINQPAIDNFIGCPVGDATCMMEGQLCDENGNCLHFAPGQHTITVNFVKNGVPTPVATETFKVTAQ